MKTSMMTIMMMASVSQLNCGGRGRSSTIDLSAGAIKHKKYGRSADDAQDGYRGTFRRICQTTNCTRLLERHYNLPGGPKVESFLR